MKRGEIIISIIILIIGIIILAYLSKYTNLTLSKYPIVPFENNEQLNNIISVSEEELISGLDLKIKKKSIIKLNIDDKNYLLNVLEISENKKEVILATDESNLMYLKEKEESKKINLNNDDSYDLELKINSINLDEADLNLRSTEEKITVLKNINEEIEKVILEFDRSYKTQSRIIIFILVLVLMIIVIYFFKTVFFKHNKAEIQKPSETLDYLFSKFEENKKNKQKAKEIYSRIKHFFSYLTKEEKRIYRQKLKNIERYINSVE